MRGFKFAGPWLVLCVAAGILPAQSQSQVDFAKDVQPIFRQNCVGCHGPAVQTSGLRLDRRSAVLGRKGVVPGSPDNSFLFHRISGNDFGMQMPPTGALKPEQVATIRAWIEQGAPWPDALANEVELPPIDPKAVALVELLPAGDVAGFVKAATAEPKLLNARGPEGSTPFMYSALYLPAATLEQLLKLGADPNRKNDANATALMWAAADLEKTRVLLNHGADVNARSSDMRTALMIAARRPGNAATVKLLLEKGAKVNPNAHAGSESSPLIEAATAADAASMELLLSHGAETKDSGEMALEASITLRCAKCVAMMMAKPLEKDAYTTALTSVAGLGDVAAVRALLEKGANVNAVDPLGRTPLMYAASSEIPNLEVVKLLVEHKADVNAKDGHKLGADTGWTPLDMAKLRGDTPVVRYLMQAGAKATVLGGPVLKARGQNTIASAIQSSLPLIQKADASFMPKAACASCHNNSFAAMAVGLARSKGFAVDEKTAGQQVMGNIFGLVKLRDILHQSFFLPVEDYPGPSIVSFILLGLDAEHYKADLNTDTVAMYLKAHQAPDGEWPYPVADTRPPICSDYIGQTAIAMRALQLYAPKADKAAYEQAVQLAANWIAKAQPRNNDDRGWKALGLAWAGKGKAAQAALKELLAAQKADGGWADLDTMASSAYATGKALVTLNGVGVPVTDAAYQRGVKYLLSTQQEDGSWYVKSRALGFQPYFDAGFPYGFDQWVSAAGSSWATMALSLASPVKSAAAEAQR